MRSSSKEALTKCDTWESFQKNLTALTDKEKGDAFEVLTKSYLSIDPVYASKFKNVWLLKEVPYSLRQYLNLPTKDMGIDLVAETHEGQYWAIQCKYRESNSPIGWGEISTFVSLTFKICQNFSFGLICYTGSKYTKLIAGQPQIGFCSNEIWRQLDKDFFQKVHQLLAGNSIERVPLTPRPHQQRAIENAKDYFGYLSTTRGKLIMPCGSGKSLTAFWIAQTLNARKIIIAVPSLALIKQTLHVWLREYTAMGRAEDLSWLCVCSDSTVSEFRDDELLETVGELGIPCITDEMAIKGWLLSNDDKIKIVFTTYQSSKALGRASKQAGTIFDLAILDEAHKTVGDLSRSFAFLLSDNHVDIRRRIFMTATERYYNGRRDQIASMNNSALYGETFEQLSFREALSHKPAVVAPYRIITLSVTKSEISEAILSNKYVQPKNEDWSEKIEAKMLAAIIALNKAMSKYPIKHAITYHSSIPRAKAFSRYVEAYCKSTGSDEQMRAFHVSGNMSTNDRQDILQEFANSPKAIVSNARCLVEGVDLPGVDCVLFADPRKSKIDTIQALGRALRPHAGKRFGYIIIPIVIDDEGDIADFIDSSEFSDFLTTLRDLASGDERIVEYFQIRSTPQTERIGTFKELDDLFKIDIAENINIDEFSNAINLQCWDRLSKLAYRPYRSAKRFVQELRLRNEKDWFYYCTGRLHGYSPKPPDIPMNPDAVYGEAWEGWKSWLGEKSSGNKSVSFESAREFARRLELKNKNEWERFVKGEFREYLGPVWAYVPPNPEKIYFKEWKGWEDWLAPKNYYSFDKSRSIVRTWGARNRKDWFKIVSREWEKAYQGDALDANFEHIPWRPNFVYRDSWLDWGDWLGNPSQAVYREKHHVNINTSVAKPAKPKIEYLPYEHALSFARKLELQTITDWRSYCNGYMPNLPPKPVTIPDHPNKVYRQYWRGWRSWLGPRIRNYNFLEARTFARKLNLSTVKEWELFCVGKLQGHPIKPKGIPNQPQEVYKDEWAGWIDWLVEPPSRGTEQITS